MPIAFSHMWCTGMMNMAYAKHWCAIISTMDVDLVKEDGSASNTLPAADMQTGCGKAMLHDLAQIVPHNA